MSKTLAESPFTVAIYNPALLKKEDLIRGFVARQPLLDRLLEDLRREARDHTPQHHLIIGQRGFGKTTLLRRLAFAVEDDSALAATWMPLVFPEEQYNVASLGDFWLNCVDALSDALDRTGDRLASQALDSRVASVPTTGEERSRSALNLLLAEADRLGRRILLLVDNLDIVLDRLGENEEWEFRRVISEERRLHIIGASSRVLETLYEHGRAFYDFFQIHELKGLDERETLSTLCQLAERSGNAEVLKLVRSQPGRIKALRVLTGGNPRTLLLLFKVLAQGPDGDVQRDLEQLLDEYTALYKARFEELAPQAQQVVDALAIHWDPLTAADLTELLSPLGVNQVSAQLKRLEDFGVVEKTPWFGEKKNAFQIAERFFNIWYLMRASRRVRRKLLWLVKFLETWFDREELNARARGFLDQDPEALGRERYAEMALAYSQAVMDTHLQRSLESAGLHAVLDDGVGRLIDYSDFPSELQDKKERIQQLRELRERTCNLNIDWDGIEPTEFWRLLGGSPNFSLGDKARIVEQLPSVTLNDLHQLHGKLLGFTRRMSSVFRESADVARLQEALAGGEIADVYDSENTVALAKRYGLNWLPFTAVRTRVDPFLHDEELSEGEIKTAESALRTLAREPGFELQGWTGLGLFLQQRLWRFDEAEEAIRRAIEAAPQSAYSWNCLGLLLKESPKRYDEAEGAFRRSVELDPKAAWTWNSLGIFLQNQVQRYDEAEQAYRRATELDPQFAQAWNSLGLLLRGPLKRYGEAERAFRHSIELDPQFSVPWCGLGLLLLDSPKRYDESEQAFEHAIELDPQAFFAWNGLGILFQHYLDRQEEAAQAYRHAVEINPQLPLVWSSIGELLELLPGRQQEAAEASLRAFEIDSTRATDLDRFLRICDRLAESADELPGVLKMAQQAQKLTQDNPASQFLVARLLTLTEKWPDASTLLVHLASNESAFFSEGFFQTAVKAGHLDEVIAILARTGASDRWRPLYEALQAVRAGTPDYLRKVAPEVRTVATRILRNISPDLFPEENKTHEVA